MAMYEPGLLRAFVAVVEHGSFTRAAQVLHLTQSTVSQQVRRLEEDVGQPLLEREGGVRPTAAGERLLGYARRLLALGAEARAAMAGEAPQKILRLGLPEDLAGALLTPVLAAFARAQGDGLRLEVSSGLSAELLAGYRRGEFDVVLAKQRQGDGAFSWPERVVWVDSRAHPCWGRDPLPLAVFPEGGLYREEMFEALDARHLRWRIAYSSRSLASLRAAVAEGLGVSLLPERAVRAGHRVLGRAEGLPTGHPMRLVLHHRGEASASTRALVARLVRRCEALVQG
ncbi:LysR family transcriptional regulator [Aerolutibacter daejeonensis]|nr:LysR substrate-binding domain-containing protein [Lysobacter daejeonensis]